MRLQDPGEDRESSRGVADWIGVDVVERIRVCPDPTSWLDRIIAGATENDDGCWIWNSTPDRSGYGRFFHRVNGVRKMTGAHRAAWLAFRGDIPGDLVTDHLCRVRACVNPWHMELATNQVNVIRGDVVGAKPGRSGRKANQSPGCGRHGLLDVYRATRRDGYERWVCRICAAERQLRYRKHHGLAA